MIAVHPTPPPFSHNNSPKKASNRPISPPVASEDLRAQNDLLSPPTGGDRKPLETIRSNDSSADEASFREYTNDFFVEDFIMDIATVTKRPLEKAKEWLVKLKAQDIMTVGDLRHLHDEDWAQLNLTVFACRAIRNALCAKPKSTLAGMQSQTTIRSAPLKPQSLLEDSTDNLVSSSPVASPTSMANQLDLHSAPLIS